MRRASTLPPLAQTLWAVGYVALGIAIATAAAWPIYQTPRLVLVAAVAGTCAMAIAFLSAWRRWSWWVTALAVAAGYVVLAVPLAIPGALTSPQRALEGVRDGLAGLVLGWKQLVTIELPLGQYQAVLVPFFAVVYLGGFAALSLALRPGRASTVAVPIVLGMFVFGVAFGASELGRPIQVLWIEVPGGALVLLGLAALVVSLVWLVGRSRLERAAALRRGRGATVGVRQSREGTWPVIRRNALGVIILALALIVGLVAAPLATDAAQRSTLRDTVEPYLNVSHVQSPLTTYRGWFAGDSLDADLFTVTSTEGTLDRLRLATLTEFDGSRFELADSSAAHFTRLANSQPASSDVTVDITIGEGYSGPWLPLPGVTTAAPQFGGTRGDALSDGLYVAPGGATAVVVDSESAASGVIRSSLQSGDSVTVTGTPVADAGVLDEAQGGEPLIDGEVYVSLSEWVDMQELPRTGDGLVEAVQRLRERGFLSHARTEDAASEGWIRALTTRADYTFEPSLAGHSISRIETLFSSMVDQQVKAGEDADPSRLVSGVGDDEQFAVAAALLARYFGFDSRVVFGVVLASDEALPSVAPCSSDGTCTGANVTAWTEVQAPNGTWARVDATPQFAEPISRVVVGEILPEHPTIPDEPTSEVMAPPNSVRADSDEPPANSSDDAVARDLLEVLRWVAIGLAILILLTLPVIVLALAKTLQRRRRRTEPVAEASIVGAWDELVDRYVDAGLITNPGGTRRQVAAAVGRPAAMIVADAADYAVFNSVPSAPATATAVWDVVVTERREVAKSVPFRQRVAAALSTAAFVRHIRRVTIEKARARRRGAA